MTELQNLSLPAEAPSYEPPPPYEQTPGPNINININTVPGPRLPHVKRTTARCSWSPSAYQSQFPGLVRDQNGRVPGFVPEAQYAWEPDDRYSGPGSATTRNVPLLNAMAESGMKDKWWRVAEFYDQPQKDKSDLSDCCLMSALSCGVLPCRRPWMVSGGRDSIFRRSEPSTYNDKTFGRQGSGWRYIIVPEIAIDWMSIKDHFPRIQDMGKIARLVIGQRKLDTSLLMTFRAFSPEPPPVAPGGQWARARDDPLLKDRLVRVLDDHFWVFMFVGDTRIDDKSVPHGIQHLVTLTQAVDALLAAERDFMTDQAPDQIGAHAVPIWPPIEYIT